MYPMYPMDSTYSMSQISNSYKTTGNISSLSRSEEDLVESGLNDLYEELMHRNSIFEKNGLDLNDFMNYLVFLVKDFTLYGTGNELLTLQEFLINISTQYDNPMHEITLQEVIKQYCIAILKDIRQFYPNHPDLLNEIKEMIYNLNTIITNFKLNSNFDYDRGNYS